MKPIWLLPPHGCTHSCVSASQCAQKAIKKKRYREKKASERKIEEVKKKFVVSFNRAESRAVTKAIKIYILKSRSNKKVIVFALSCLVLLALFIIFLFLLLHSLTHSHVYTDDKDGKFIKELTKARRR